MIPTTADLDKKYDEPVQQELPGVPAPKPLDDRDSQYVAHIICDLARTFKSTGLPKEKAWELVQQTFEQSPKLNTFGWTEEIRSLAERCIGISYRE
jgi:hypothetical protein